MFRQLFREPNRQQAWLFTWGVFIWLFVALVLGLLSGCHNDDDDDIAPPPVNEQSIDVTLSGDQETPAVTTDATGQGNFTINTDTGAVSGTVTTTGMTATEAHIHTAFAGDNGDILIPLESDGSGGWEVPADTQLDEDGMDKFRAGELYVNVHSADHTEGEIRAQLLPSEVEVVRVALDGLQQVPSVTSSNTAIAAITLNRDERLLTIHVNGTGVEDATAVSVQESVAGRNGEIVLPLTQDTEDPLHWSLATQTLDTEQMDELLGARWYLNIQTPAQTEGELRSQLVFTPYELIVTELSGAEEVPEVSTENSAVATTTVNHEDKTLELHVNATGLDDATAAHIHQAIAGQNGDPIITLTQDDTDPTHWFVTETTLEDSVYTQLQSDGLYVNVHTPAFPDGEVRGQLLPQTDDEEPVDGLQPTLSSIQAEIFTPICTACHTGPAAPQGLRLTEGEAYGLLVDVDSSEQPTIKRVAAGDPDNSYLIQKLEGTAATGERMPLGGPYLSQEQIDVVRQWISDGALNN